MEKLMADDERRAEIEALKVIEGAARAMAGWSSIDTAHSRTVQVWGETILAALDHVRDARGDDEATYPPDRLTAGEAPRPAEWEAWQARTPQVEDHCHKSGGS